MGPFDRSTLEQFAALIAARLGLQFDEGKFDLLAEVLQRRLQARGRAHADAYLARLASDAGEREELRVLAAHLTVTETYFFRTAEHFQTLAETALPQRLRARGGRRPVRLLSAGCASGDEAYSMAILVEEHFPDLDAVNILGIDVNPAALASAREACYRPWSLRETRPEIRDRYFTREDNQYVLLPRIRSMVQWEERNLGVDEGPAWRPQPFDIIFCRNVIMYLVPEAARLAVARLSAALAPGGFLFLSHAENLRGISQDFHLRHTHDTFYYQKREEGEEPAAAKQGQPAPEVLPPVDGQDLSWFEAVERASARIQSLSRDTGPQGASSAATCAPVSPGRPVSVQLGLALELQRQERYREALEAVQGLPPELAGDRDVELLRAVLLVNCGEVQAAEAACDQLLSWDELNAGARYITALCREQAGDYAGAVEEDRAAVYLDHTFAMPHLHLALLARRAGDPETARREMAEARALLLREDSSRILLLGGGFSRQALIAFSQGQLRACGGAA